MPCLFTKEEYWMSIHQGNNKSSHSVKNPRRPAPSKRKDEAEKLKLKHLTKAYYNIAISTNDFEAASIFVTEAIGYSD